MSSEIRKLRNRQRFTRAMKRQAARAKASGEMGEEKYKEVMLACADHRVMQKAIEEIEGSPDMYGGFDWAKIGQWLKDNWKEILKLVISLVVMFL
jgi:hypothetical protein